MKKLIITEKPSVATEFIKTLEAHYERNDGYYEGENHIVTWCVGHLVTMSYPEAYGEEYKKWAMETLPFLPENYRYEVIDGVKKQFKVVKECLNRKDIDTIYYAGDAAREGEYIQRLVRQCAGRNKDAVEKRIWIDSQTEDEIKKGVREAKPLEAYDTICHAGYMRAIEDYLIGINFSRGLSIKYGNRFNQWIASTKYTPISVGRVMSCVLGMIVQRERAIRDNVQTPFFGIKAVSNKYPELELKWKSTENSAYFQSPLLFKEDAFSREEDAKQFVGTLSQNGHLFITSKKKTNENKNAPLLYNLAELQSDCSNKFKISPDETLQVIQSLYDKKMATYPRTDARVLSTAIAMEIEKNISGLQNLAEIGSFAKEILKGTAYKNIANTKYTNDAMVTDHYAIIPTGNTAKYGELSELERKVFALITKRFLAIFYPAAVYRKITVKATQNNEEFSASAKYLGESGYLALYDVDNFEEDSASYKALDALEESKEYEFVFESVKGITSAPKRYTSGSIILAMENAGNLIEDEELRGTIKNSGIGTSATRAEIIKKLVGNKYIALQKNTQVLTPTATGEVLFEIIKASVPSLLSPEMTASWEKGLTAIVNGEVSKDVYSKKLNQYVVKEIANIKENNILTEVGEKVTELKKIYPNIVLTSSTKSSADGKSGIPCPLCGKAMIKHQWGYGCSGYQDGCKMSVGRNLFGAKNLTDTQIETLLKKQKVNNITFISKAKNKEYKANLVMDKETGKCNLEFAK